MKFDFHTHCFPDILASYAISKLTETSNGLKPNHDGTFSGLKQLMEKQGVNGFAIMNIATNPKQMLKVNDFAYKCKSESEYIEPFGSVHPDAENVLEELDRIKELGLKGIKFHPDYQGFYVDDSKMIPIYKKASNLGLVVLFHAGLDPAYTPPFKCTPQRLLNALKYLDTNVVAAHWGSATMGEDVYNYLAGEDVYIDSSFGNDTLDKQLALKIVEKHGTDKILFASDAPWHTPEMETKYIESLELSESEKNDIYWNNAAMLLSL